MHISKKSSNFARFLRAKRTSEYTHMRTKNIIILLLTMLTIVSCGEFQKLQKSTDPELKFTKAIEYFNDKKYSKAQLLFDDVSAYYKGTERSEEVLIYLARCYMGQKDYASAAEYYSAYTRNYPKGEHIMEATFMLAHSYYMDSPDARLDQEQTKKAIESYQLFVERYPESQYVQQAYDEMQEMTDKLAEKELYSARLYYNLGTYLGNNYLSAETVAKNAIKHYPSNKHMEEFSWIILQAKYKQLEYSVNEMKEDRARNTQDEYYSFITEYPESKHRKEAEAIGKAVKKILGEE